MVLWSCEKCSCAPGRPLIMPYDASCTRGVGVAQRGGAKVGVYGCMAQWCVPRSVVSEFRRIEFREAE